MNTHATFKLVCKDYGTSKFASTSARGLAMLEEIAALRTQRDELLGALGMLVGNYVMRLGDEGENAPATLKAALAVLTKADRGAV